MFGNTQRADLVGPPRTLVLCDYRVGRNLPELGGGAGCGAIPCVASRGRLEPQHPQQPPGHSRLLQTRIRSLLQILGLALPSVDGTWPSSSRRRRVRRYPGAGRAPPSFLPYFPRGAELPAEPLIPSNCTREHRVHCLVPLPENKP